METNELLRKLKYWKEGEKMLAQEENNRRERVTVERAINLDWGETMRIEMKRNMHN